MTGSRVADPALSQITEGHDGGTRRDFLALSAGAFGARGTVIAICPLWLCPCHGPVYDTSARIREGPAPLNLFVPPFEFAAETVIKTG